MTPPAIFLHANSQSGERHVGHDVACLRLSQQPVTTSCLASVTQKKGCSSPVRQSQRTGARPDSSKIRSCPSPAPDHRLSRLICLGRRLSGPRVSQFRYLHFLPSKSDSILGPLGKRNFGGSSHSGLPLNRPEKTCQSRTIAYVSSLQ